MKYEVFTNTIKIKMMSKKIFLLLSIVIFVACNSNNQQPTTDNSELTIYTCSMDPQVKEDKPGKCPICHMELTPIKHDETEANEISL
ncbi:MAG TPA: heavy metal-binding domain-containing protein, partial [Flavobacterium sp.]